MKFFSLVLWLSVACSQLAAENPSVSEVISGLNGLTLDPKETYHVRELRLARGDVTFYLTDGYLSFAQPVAGRRVAALFTTAGTETGEAEVLVTPPSRGERASLAHYVHTPAVEERVAEAAFLFNDTTWEEIKAALKESDIKPDSKTAAALAPKWVQTLRTLARDLEVPVAASILNGASGQPGIFYGVIRGERLGVFDVTYDPLQVEDTTLGRVAPEGDHSHYEIWTSFRSRKSSKQPPEDPLRCSQYHIETTITPDLRVSAVTRFRLTASVPGIRAVDLELTQLMHVESALVNGKAAEIVQHDSVRDVNEDDVGRFLVVVPEALPPGEAIEFEVHHQGPVIQVMREGTYYVEARNIWFPHRPLGSATFDLTFHSPPQLRVVASGRLVSEQASSSERTVHRVIDTPVPFVGFNVGDYAGLERDAPPFRVECFSNRNQPGADPVRSQSVLTALATRAGEILHAYSDEFGPASTSNVAITPIAGSFGQGFPGLIYLSTLSYLPPASRPANVRGPVLDEFYSDILLLHEIAHQWWGNLVIPSDYRSGWIVEALANYVAIDLYAKNRGAGSDAPIYRYYTDELRRPDRHGGQIGSAAPLDLGLRLRNSDEPEVWRVVTYSKGTWVVRMLQQRLGEAGWNRMVRDLMATFKDRRLSNDDLRAAAARYVNARDPDPTLELFFDDWVYGTAIPRLSLSKGSDSYTLHVSGTERDFNIDVPIQVVLRGQTPKVQWVRASTGETQFTVPRFASASVSLPDPNTFLYLQQ